MDHLTAPWSPDQIEALNRFQLVGRFHPFTCGQRDQHPGNSGVLVATGNGWVCPAGGCDYRQNWALPFMAAPLPADPLDDLRAKMRAEVSDRPRTLHDYDHPEGDKP